MVGRALLVLLVITGTVWASESNQIVFKTCRALSSVQRCKVKSVEVTGCEKEKSHDMNHIPSGDVNQDALRTTQRKYICDVSKKTQLNFTIAIHSGFSTDRLSSQFTATDGPGVDCSPVVDDNGEGHCLFREYVRDGCRGTRCPLTADATQAVTDYLKVNPDSSITKRTYNVQWKLWNKSNKKENCCFTFKLQYY